MECVRRMGGAVVLCAVLLGCGSDDKKGQPCPEGLAVGGTTACACGDAGGAGVQTCQQDKTLTDCDCSGGTLLGTGGSTGTGGIVSTGTGGTPSGTGGTTPGTGGTTPEPDMDAGAPAATDGGTTPGTGGTVAPPPPPMDGNQGAVCTNGTDCNMGLDCYTTGGGLDFCSAVCTTDENCTGLAGATWTCSMTLGVCEVECMGMDDVASCPDGMVCMSTGGFPGVGGGGMFRCKYPISTAGLEGFSECMMSMDCAAGLQCIIGFVPGSSGFCSITCMGDGDCAGLGVPSGTITPTCGTANGCVLDCAGATDGCPDGMNCVTLGAIQRCAYP